MFIGTALLIAAILALVLALAISLLDLKERGTDRKRGEFAVMTTYGAFAALGAALVALAAAFLVGDLSIHYVWANTDQRYTWFQRLSGLWVGRAGSLLLWAGLLLALWCIEEARHRRALRHSDRRAATSANSANPPGTDGDATGILALLKDAEAVRRVARPLALSVVLLMALVVLHGRPFLPSTELDLMEAPFGRGMNPQLLVFYNAIHPPVVFLGYAATLLPAVFGIAHLATGRRGWVGVARRWAHVAFLTLTIGVALGALWAYIALGWGGYWDWDPVEVASLVPWLVITAFLHAAYRYDSKGQFAVAAPVIAAVAFAASVFSTLVVRSGVWVSLHSFLGEGDATNALGRFFEAFNAQWEVRLFALLVTASLLTVFALVPRHVRRVEDAIGESDAARVPAPGRGGVLERALRHVTLGNLFVVGVLTLVLLTTVTVTLLLVGVNGFSSSGVRETIYTERTGPIALTAVTVMGVAVAIGTLAKRTILALLTGAVAVGVIAAILLPDIWALALATPILALAVGLAAVRIVLAWRRMPRRAATRFAGIHLVHVGVALLILGHGFVSTFETVEEPVEMRVGDTRSVGPYELTLLELQSTDTTGNARQDHVVATFHVQEGERDRGTTTAGFQYHAFQSHYKPTVGLLRGAGRDIYFAPAGIHDPTQGWIFGNLPLPEQGMREARDVDAITVRISTLPFINLVWGGAMLMTLGAGMLTASSWLLPHATTDRRPRRAPQDETQRQDIPTPAEPTPSPAPLQAANRESRGPRP